MTVRELCQSLSLTEFHTEDPERAVTGGYAGDFLSWVMGRAEPDCAWLTIMSNVNVCAVAVLADVACVILTEGVTPDSDLLSRCRIQGVTLLGTDKTTFDAAAALKGLLQVSCF